MIGSPSPAPAALRLPRADSAALLAAELEPILRGAAVDLIGVADLLEHRRAAHDEAGARPRPLAHPRGLVLRAPYGLPTEISQAIQALAQGALRPAPDGQADRAAADYCLRVAPWARRVDAPYTAMLFTQLARAPNRRVDAPDLGFALDLGSLAVAVPVLACRGSEWLTWVGLEPRRLGRWDIYSRALAALADRAALDSEPSAAGLLRRLARWAAGRARGSIQRISPMSQGAD